MLRFLIYKVPALAWMAFIFFMSSGPVTSPTLQETPDYLLHAGAYAVLYVALFWALHEGLDPSHGRGGFILPALITVLYGISDEFHQSFIPTRDPALHDVAADACGAVIGMTLIALAGRLSSQFRANRRL